jgi:hypothetical protein
VEGVGPMKVGCSKRDGRCVLDANVKLGGRRKNPVGRGGVCYGIAISWLAKMRTMLDCRRVYTG